MNKTERKAITDYRRQARFMRMNRYRFAWWLIQQQPNLAVAIIRTFLAQIDSELKVEP